MTTYTITRRCDCCRRPLRWSLEQLADHDDRLARGEHAACACDDDCAAECAAWSRRRLRRAIRQVEEATAELT